MEDTEYELVSHDEVDRLKKEIDRLKTNPFVQNSSEERFYEAISHLTESVNKLYQLFDNVNKQLMREYQTGNSPEEKIDKILDQNKSIAEALVSFGSKADSEQEAQEEQDTPHVQETQTQSVKTPPQISQPQAPIQQQTQNLPQQISQSSYLSDDVVPPSPAQSQNQYPQLPVQQRQQIMQQAPIQQQAPQPPQQMMFQQQVQTQPQQQQIRPQQMSQSQPQMSSTQQSQIPQAPLFQQNTVGYGSQRFQDFTQPPQPMMNQRQQSQSSESDFDVNYPVPDRFQSLNSAPSFEPPIDLRPPEPKKKGLLGGLLKK